MGIVYFNRIKAALAEKDNTSIWFLEQMKQNLGTISRWMTNRSALGGHLPEQESSCHRWNNCMI